MDGQVYVKFGVVNHRFIYEMGDNTNLSSNMKFDGVHLALAELPI